MSEGSEEDDLEDGFDDGPAHDDLEDGFDGPADDEYGTEYGTTGDDGVARDPGTGKSDGRETKYCTNCGAEIDAMAEICTECGVRQGDPGGSSDDEKDPAIAAVLSLVVVGAGQVYNGQVARGVAFFLAFVFGGGFITAITFGLAFPVMLLILVGAVFDAYNQAQKINAGEVQVD